MKISVCIPMYNEAKIIEKSAAELSVPLVADANTGKTWLDAK